MQNTLRASKRNRTGRSGRTYRSLLLASSRAQLFRNKINIVAYSIVAPTRIRHRGGLPLVGNKLTKGQGTRGTHRFARKTRGVLSTRALSPRVSSAGSGGRSGGTNLSCLYRASSDGDPTPSLGWMANLATSKWHPGTMGTKRRSRPRPVFCFIPPVDMPRYLSCILTLADLISDIFLCLARSSRNHKDRGPAGRNDFRIEGQKPVPTARRLTRTRHDSVPR